MDMEHTKPSIMSAFHAFLGSTAESWGQYITYWHMWYIDKQEKNSL